MGIKFYRPTSPGRRGGSVLDYAEITKTTPEKSLISGKRRTGGRNNHGRITMRHQGGGHKQHYRVVDFRRDKVDVAGKVVTAIQGAVGILGAGRGGRALLTFDAAMVYDPAASPLIVRWIARCVRSSVWPPRNRCSSSTCR